DGTPFSDVVGDEWYGRAIGILANFGIVDGYDDGTFRPNAPISRKEFAAVVSRFDNLANTDHNPYTDLNPNDWAYRYILSATQKGWFIGYRDLFRPDAHLTRAEMVTAINRIFDRITLLEDVPDNVFRFRDLDESHWAYADFMEAAHTHTYQRRDINNTEVWIEIIETGLDAPYNR
ncbi:MAG: S-layer homology domain-containing protein, partial [Oscillospiraceae bacterium]|nr:S-layer homology domain-containing protein [Oscillospiraceae bacterium]